MDTTGDLPQGRASVLLVCYGESLSVVGERAAGIECWTLLSKIRHQNLECAHSRGGISDGSPLNRAECTNVT